MTPCDFAYLRQQLALAPDDCVYTIEDIYAACQHYTSRQWLTLHRTLRAQGRRQLASTVSSAYGRWLAALIVTPRDMGGWGKVNDDDEIEVPLWFAAASEENEDDE